jgi:hypothetical protein
MSLCFWRRAGRKFEEHFFSMVTVLYVRSAFFGGSPSTDFSKARWRIDSCDILASGRQNRRFGTEFWVPSWSAYSRACFSRSRRFDGDISKLSNINLLGSWNSLMVVIVRLFSKCRTRSKEISIDKMAEILKCTRQYSMPSRHPHAECSNLITRNFPSLSGWISNPWWET